jgi:hypothetical protein
MDFSGEQPQYGVYRMLTSVAINPSIIPVTVMTRPEDSKRRKKALIYYPIIPITTKPIGFVLPKTP